MDYVWFGLGAGLAIVVLVVVHEFGHFVAAKIFGIGVPVFSIGMGPRLFGFRWGETDYRVSAVPVGGYVRLYGADPFGEEDFESERLDVRRDFMKRPVWQRLVVLFAGPAANLVLPIVLFSALFIIGYPEYPTTFGFVSYDSPAARVGLKSGDRIVAVGDVPVASWRELNWTLAPWHDRAVTLTVDRAGQTLTVEVPANTFHRVAGMVVDHEMFGVDPGLRSSQIGVGGPGSPAYEAGLRTFDAIVGVDGRAIDTWDELTSALATEGPHRVDYVRADEKKGRTEGSLTLQATDWAPRAEDPFPNPYGLAPVDVFAYDFTSGSPAKIAGIKVGDRLYMVNGQPVHDFLQFRSLVWELGVDPADPTAMREVTLTMLRDGNLVERTFQPQTTTKTTIYGSVTRPLLGLKSAREGYLSPERVLKSYAPHEAVMLGWTQTGQAASSVLTALESLVLVRSNPGDVVGGPVQIFAVTGRSLMLGVHAYASTIASISVSLAIVNLLPVPALDGGQIVVYALEWVRGRPLSAELRMRIQMVGVLVLFALIVLVTVKDVTVWFTGAS
jgi:regulator of sigma E protease